MQASKQWDTLILHGTYYTRSSPSFVCRQCYWYVQFSSFLSLAHVLCLYIHPYQKPILRVIGSLELVHAERSYAAGSGPWEGELQPLLPLPFPPPTMESSCLAQTGPEPGSVIVCSRAFRLFHWGKQHLHLAASDQENDMGGKAQHCPPHPKYSGS